LREQILPAVEEEVHNWAAAQASLATDENRSRIIEEVIGKVQKALPKALEELRSPVKVPSLDRGPTGNQYDVRAATPIQHFNVSIGPISVSVEPPRREAPSRRSSPKSSAPAAVNTASSRLSRHYIVP